MQDILVMMNGRNDLMKTLILNGSPRRNGDTVSLLDILKDGLDSEVTQLDAYYADIAPCNDCRACRVHDGCVVDDDMSEIYRLLPDADNIVIASPIYFSEITGRLLDVCSRLQTYYSARFFRGERIVFKPKKGAVILVGGGDGSGERADETSRCILMHMGCKSYFPTVLSHNTNNIPAAEDKAAVEAVKSLAHWLSES